MPPRIALHPRPRPPSSIVISSAAPQKQLNNPLPATSVVSVKHSSAPVSRVQPSAPQSSLSGFLSQESQFKQSATPSIYRPVHSMHTAIPAATPIPQVAGPQFHAITSNGVNRVGPSGLSHMSAIDPPKAVEIRQDSHVQIKSEPSRSVRHTLSQRPPPLKAAPSIALSQTPLSTLSSPPIPSGPLSTPSRPEPSVTPTSDDSIVSTVSFAGGGGYWWRQTFKVWNHNWDYKHTASKVKQANVRLGSLLFSSTAEPVKTERYPKLGHTSAIPPLSSLGMCCGQNYVLLYVFLERNYTWKYQLLVRSYWNRSEYFYAPHFNL